jgi:type IV pilus assembly protein PilV
MHVAEVEAYQRAQALVLTSDMMDRIAANRANAPAYDTTVGGPLGTGDSQPASCSALTGAARDKCEWSQALKGASETSKASLSVGAMIGARGCVETVQKEDKTPGICKPGIYRVSVSWQGLNKTSAPALQCGAGLYGDSLLQRTVSLSISSALLSCS